MLGKNTGLIISLLPAGLWMMVLQKILDIMYCYGGMAVAMGNRKGGRGSIWYTHKPNDTCKISANIKVASSDVSTDECLH